MSQVVFSGICFGDPIGASSIFHAKIHQCHRSQCASYGYRSCFPDERWRGGRFWVVVSNWQWKLHYLKMYFRIKKWWFSSQPCSRRWFLVFFICTRTWEEWSNLIDIFQMVWNYHLGFCMVLWVAQCLYYWWDREAPNIVYIYILHI